MMPLAYAAAPLDSRGRTKAELHGCRLVIALGIFIVLAASARAQTPVFIKDNASSKEAGPSGIKSVARLKEGTITRETPCVAKIDDVISVEVGNLAGWLEKLKTDKVINSEATGEALVWEQLPNLNLFIGEHMMKTLHPTEYNKDDPGWYPPDSEQSKTAPRRSWLEFSLKRDSANKTSREVWDPVLRTPGISPKMELAVGIYDANRNIAHVMALPLPMGAYTPSSQLEFRLRLIALNDVWTGVGLGLLLLAVGGFLYLLVRSGIVRDTSCAVREDGLPPLSLGRCQMAFWFFLVIGAFYFIWIITGRGDTDTINSTVLTLIGISAGTGLGSVIASKKEADTAEAKNEAAKAAYPSKIKDAKRALRAAEKDRKKLGPKDTDEITAKDAEIKEKKAEVADLKAKLKDWRRDNRGQLLLDLLSEDEGSGRVIAFHRFQIVAWTLVLGVVFFSEVKTKLAMPEFNSTLLTLMGISSGTYLGFKISAK